MTAQTPRFVHDLFVSYAHVDDHDGWITALVESIRAEHARFTPTPLEVFFDRAAIRTAHDWEHRILQGLRHSRAMLAVLSPAYFASAYCRKEWEAHIEHELDRAMPGEGIAPIYTITVPSFDNEAPAALDRWLDNLRRRQYLDLRSWRADGPDALRREEARRRLEALELDLDRVFRKADLIASSPTTIPPHNPNFVGRVDELSRLRKALTAGRVGAISAVHGIGGMGKSALAFEYAHAFADVYPGGRFLVPCAGVSDVRIPIVNLADARGINLTPDDRKDLAASHARVRAAFERGPRSLLLLDNVDDPGLLTPHQVARTLPSSDAVHVLVTTCLEPERLRGLDCLSLDSLPEADALRLLEKYRPFPDDDEWKAALRIVRRLGGHPLAVEVVAVFLWQTPEVSYASYASRLEREGLGAVEGPAREEGIALSRHPEALLSVLLEPTLSRLSPPELLTLEYAALLPPDTIALPWLHALVGRAFPEFSDAPSGHADPWKRLLRHLHGLRLLVPGDSDHLARMHRIVQDVVSARLGAAGTADRREPLVEHADSRGEYLWEGWVDHAARWEIAPLRDFALLLLESDQAKAGIDLVNWVSQPLRTLGSFNESRNLLRRAVATGKGVYAPDHPTLALSYSSLALAERDLGELGEARRLMRMAITIWEKTYPPDQLNLARGYSNLATVERALGELGEARRLMRMAIEIWEKVYAPDHPILAISYSNLALVERDLGELGEAQRLIRMAIAIEEKAYPPDHPTHAGRYSNLAAVEHDLGDLGEARRLMRMAIAIDEKAYAPDHPNLALRYSNLATVEQSLGNPAEARRLMWMAIAIWEKAYAPDHPNLALSYSNLAMVEQALGELSEARRLMRKAIAIGEKAYALDHPNLALSYSNLAGVEQELGDLTEARRLMRMGYHIRLARLGSEHPDTKDSAAWLERYDRGGPDDVASGG